MDWIERLFGISPDGGNGFTEVLITFCVVFALVVVFLSFNVFGIRSALARRVFRRSGGVP
jgi:hypothetical protein